MVVDPCTASEDEAPATWVRKTVSFVFFKYASVPDPTFTIGLVRILKAVTK